MLIHLIVKKGILRHTEKTVFFKMRQIDKNITYNMKIIIKKKILGLIAIIVIAIVASYNVQ